MIKTITLTQPWASLVSLGMKKIETRSWSTSHRGPLAIHAAKGIDAIGGVTGLRELVNTEPFRSVFAAYDAGWGTHVLTDPSYYLPRGCIIAVCELVDVRPIRPHLPAAMGYGTEGRGYEWDLTDQERAFGDYTPGRYAWLLADIRPLAQSVPVAGKLSLWEYEGELPL